jgi:succinate dehydrogenase / fumarate reductase cytochrome b subunit
MLAVRDREGYWAWLLHRVSGVAVLLFLVMHVFDTMLVSFGPGPYESFVRLYRAPAFRVMEVLLAGALLYHGINGLRVIALDFWRDGTQLQRRLWYAAWILFLAIFLPTGFLMLRPILFPATVALLGAPR